MYHEKGVERTPTPATKTSFEMIDLGWVRVMFLVTCDGVMTFALFDSFDKPR